MRDFGLEIWHLACCLTNKTIELGHQTLWRPSCAHCWHNYQFMACCCVHWPRHYLHYKNHWHPKLLIYQISDSYLFLDADKELSQFLLRSSSLHYKLEEYQVSSNNSSLSSSYSLISIFGIIIDIKYPQFRFRAPCDVQIRNSTNSFCRCLHYIVIQITTKFRRVILVSRRVIKGLLHLVIINLLKLRWNIIAPLIHPTSAIYRILLILGSYWRARRVLQPGIFSFNRTLVV